MTHHKQDEGSSSTGKPMQYVLRTIANYAHERGSKLNRQFCEQHKQADIIVTSEGGVVLYALYESPYGKHATDGRKVLSALLQVSEAALGEES